jgi:hypothetical protein
MSAFRSLPGRNTTIETEVRQVSTFSAPDFLSFSSPTTAGVPEDVVPIFACSTSDADGCGSVAVTRDAVYVGEEHGITRIDVRDIRSWSTGDNGPLFTLKVECEDTHVTYLFTRYRAATVTALTATIGPEHTRIRAA